MKILYQLHQKCFNICTKVGLENPIVKGNGDIPRKPLIVRIDPLEKVNKIQEEFREGSIRHNSHHNFNRNRNTNDNIDNPNDMSLKDSLINYDKLKK